MLVSCQKLQKKYMVDKQPVLAADTINLDIARSDFLTILGHSGSGKTTLLSLIGGLTTPDSGKILIDGKDVWSGGDTEISQVRNQTIGFIFQFASLIPTLTAYENLLLPLSFVTGKPTGRQQAEQLLEEVGLIDKRNCFPAELSGGQQRRIAIARAFMNNPQLILADEPTGDLDEETEADIMQLFYRRHEQGTTFVIVTHNSQLAKGHKSLRVLQMKNGQLMEQ
jgi:ABC-type lipoprotein export system ATPase subunit